MEWYPGEGAHCIHSLTLQDIDTTSIMTNQTSKYLLTDMRKPASVQAMILDNFQGNFFGKERSSYNISQTHHGADTLILSMNEYKINQNQTI